MAARGAGSAAGVKLAVHLPESVRGHVGVDLGGGDIGVSEHDLDRAQVGAALQQVGGKRVPQAVGSDLADQLTGL